jgi:tetratricopeptide (TPR) repeat protein
VTAYFNQALALERLKRYDEALASIRSALAIEADDVALQKLEFRVRLLKMRGQVLRAIGRLWPFGRGGAALPKSLD